MSSTLTNPTAGVTSSGVRLSNPTAAITLGGVRLQYSVGPTQKLGRIEMPNPSVGAFPTDGLLTLPPIKVGQFPEDGIITLPKVIAQEVTLDGATTLPPAKAGQFPEDGIITLPQVQVGEIDFSGQWKLPKPSFSNSFPYSGSWKLPVPDFSIKFEGEPSHLDFYSSVELGKQHVYFDFTGSSELGAPPLTVSVKLLYGINTIQLQSVLTPFSMDTSISYSTNTVTYGLTDHTKAGTVIPYADDITLIVSHKLTYSDNISTSTKISWAMNSETLSSHTLPYSSSTPATTSVVLPFSIPTLDVITHTSKLPYSIQNDSTSIQVTSEGTQVTDTTTGTVIDVVVVEVTPVVPTNNPGQNQSYAWTTTVETTDQATSSSISVGQSLTTQVGGTSGQSYTGDVVSITPVTNSVGQTVYQIVIGSVVISNNIVSALRTSQVSVVVNGVLLSATNTTVQTSDAQVIWTAQFNLPSKSEYAAISEDDAVIISVGSESYAMVINSKSRSKTGVAADVYTISCASPAIAYQAPRATPITKTWDVSISARAVVEEVLNQSVDWQIQDWQIAADKLAFTDATPMSIAKTVVEAIGGIVQSKPDGSLLVQYRYPSPMHTLQQAPSDQVYSDADDLLSISESIGNRQVFNSIIIRDEQTSTSSSDSLSIEVDSREDGFNEGRSTFAPGEAVHLLVRKGATSTITLQEETAGQLIYAGLVTYQHTDTLAFDNVNTHSLTYRADAIVSSVWVGDDLGAITLQTSGKDVNITAAGVGLLEVVYTTTAYKYTLYSPETVIARDEFSILAYIESTKPDAVETGNINAQVVRGAADKPAPDIVTDLLPSNGIAALRGTQELDAASKTRNVTVTAVFRPSVADGQTAEILDTSQSAVWKGKITSVSHRYSPPKLVTTLQIQRPL